MKIANNLLETIGNTPLVRVNRINTGNATILAKVENRNPGGSVKDRPALQMINRAEEQGLINKDTVIIEPTSGNTGIGLAMVCAIKGYRMILTMPETMSIERRQLLKAYGAEIILTDGAKGMLGAVEKANELHNEIENSFIPQQFSNKFNPESHYLTTAEEIWRDTDGKVDIIVAGVGTGGTISGIAKKLKEKNPKIKTFAVEPETSQVLAGKQAGTHKIQGIGANFIPDNFDKNVVDEIIPISNEDAINFAKELAKKEGILCGISSGAAMCAANKLSNRFDYQNKVIVVMLPDSGERYLSCGIYN